MYNGQQLYKLIQQEVGGKPYDRLTPKKKAAWNTVAKKLKYSPTPEPVALPAGLVSFQGRN